MSSDHSKTQIDSPVPHAYWHRAMRTLMNRGEDAADERPVQPEEWKAWLRTEPEQDPVRRMIGSLEMEIPRSGIPDYAEVLAFVLNEVPVLTSRFLGGPSSPVGLAIHETHAESLGRAAGGLNSVTWAWQSDALLAGLVAGRLERGGYFNPNDFKNLNYRAPTLDGPLAAVYPALAHTLLKAVRKGKPFDLHLRSDWLSAAQLLDILKVHRAKPRNLDALMCICVEQGQPQGLEAIATLLPDSKAGDAALFWLACAGDAGLRAARKQWTKAKGAKGRKARERITRLEGLPPGNPPSSGPRYRTLSKLDPWYPPQPVFSGPRLPATRERDWRPGPVPSTGSSPALSREKLVALRGSGPGPVHRDDLSAAEWADYLQVAALNHMGRVDVGPSWDLAMEAGWLGRGADPRLLAAAAWRASPGARRHWHDSEVQWGHLFLWAGADRDDFVHAVSLFYSSMFQRRLLGAVEEAWLAPLRQHSPPWMADVEGWLGRLEQAPPTLGLVDVRVGDGPVDWNVRRHALVATVPAGGTAKLVLGPHAITLQPAAGRLSTPSGESRFPPVAGPLPMSLTASRDGVRLTLGSVLWRELSCTPGEARAEGVVDVALHREEQPMWDALLHVLLGYAAGVGQLAAVQSDDAARLAVLVALLRPDCQPEAVSAALGQLGDHATPYLAHLGRQVTPPTLAERGFEAVVDALAGQTGKPIQREADDWVWAPAGGSSWRFTGPVLQHLVERPASARDVINLCQSCPLYPDGDAPEEVQVRETIGVQETSWMLIPPDGGFGNGPLFYQLRAAVWPVEDGYVLALWSGHDVRTPHGLMGVPFLPVTPWSTTTEM